MIFTIIEHPASNTVAFVFDNSRFDGYDVWMMMQNAFPNHRAPGLEYYGLHCYGGYENAITFVH
jgi:hypothetical protein